MADEGVFVMQFYIAENNYHQFYNYNYKDCTILHLSMLVINKVDYFNKFVDKLMLF